MNITMPLFLTIKSGARASLEQLNRLKEQASSLNERFIASSISNDGLLHVDYKTHGGYFVRKSFSQQGEVVSRTFYKDYDHIHKTPLQPLFG